MIEAKTIESYFGRYGWSVEKVGEKVWRTAFRGDVAVYPLYLRLTGGFIFIAISPFVLTGAIEQQERFYWALLRYNREMDMAKFAVDADGDVVLAIELPAQGFDYGAFEEALDLLCQYADLSYLELLNLAQDPKSKTRFDDDNQDRIEGEALSA